MFCKRLQKRVWAVMLLAAAPLLAQTTNVTGTVTDPNGLAYAYGTIQPQLVVPGGATPRLNGRDFVPSTSGARLGADGSFSLGLQDNNQISPGGTQWKFTVCSAAGSIPPAAGVGSVCFNATVSITGSSQDITANLAAAAAALVNHWGANSLTAGGSAFNRLLVDNNPFATPGSFGVHVHSVIDTITPAPDQPTKYPLGDDGGFAVYGPADIHLMPLALEATSTTSVGAPGTVTVTVGSPTVGGTAKAGNATALFSGTGGAGLIIEPGGANQETIAIADWSIASGSTLTITFAKTHTQPYRIRQQGVSLFEGDIQASADRTSQLTQNYIRDGSGQINIGLSNSASVAAWPLRGLQLGNIVTGGTNLANGSLVFRMNNAASHFTFVNAANSQTLIDMDDTGNLTVNAPGTTATFRNISIPSGTASALAYITPTANGAAGGAFRLATTDTVNWRNAGNSADISLQKDSGDLLLWNSLRLPSVIAVINSSANTANIAPATLYAVPAAGAGLYRVDVYVIVNRAATTSSTLPNLALTWTDNDNGTIQTNGLSAVSGSPSGNSLTTFFQASWVVNAQASTNITYQTGNSTAYASVGATSMQYSVKLRVTPL